MADFIKGTSVSVAFVLMKDAFPAIPDVGSATYTLYDHTGATVQGHTAVPVATTSTTTQVVVTLPSSVNLVAPDRAFEKRRVILSWNHAGRSCWLQQDYRLVAMLPHTVTPSLVRGFLGLNEKELEDLERRAWGAYEVAYAQATNTSRGESTWVLVTMGVDPLTGA